MFWICFSNRIINERAGIFRISIFLAFLQFKHSTNLRMEMKYIWITTFWYYKSRSICFVRGSECNILSLFVSFISYCFKKLKNICYLKTLKKELICKIAYYWFKIILLFKNLKKKSHEEMKVIGPTQCRWRAWITGHD